jgi:hypothetical protein
MGLTAKFGQTKDLVVVLISGMKKTPVVAGAFLISSSIIAD